MRFNLPHKVSNSYARVGFCAWYMIADSIPGYNINITCIKRIKAMFHAKKGFKTTHLKGMDEFIQAELEANPTEDARHGQGQLKSLIKNARKKLRSVLDIILLRLVQVKKKTR